MSKNILIIGSYSAEGVDSFSWWQELPNLSDYDTVILDTTKIYTYWALGGRLKDSVYYDYSISNINEQDERIASNLELVKKKLLEIIEFDVSIFAIYSPNISVDYDDRSYKGDVSDIDTNGWCPISIDVVREKGKTILVKDNSYEEYFKHFKNKGWEYYFRIDTLDSSELEEYLEPKWKAYHTLKFLAINKVEKPIAIKFTPYLCPWEDEKHNSWIFSAGKPRGNLILLPTNDIYHTSHLIENLLLSGKTLEETPRPLWVNKIEIPGSIPLKSEIVKLKQERDSLESNIKGQESALDKLENHKRLLYATGPELQDICKLTLEEIGAKTKPSDVTDEFMIEINGKEALIEVKGNTKSITKDDLSQLIADLAQQIRVSESPNIIKGILVGNAWRELPLDERSNKDIFTRHVVKYAEAQNIGLLSTVELFNAYCRVLEETKQKQEILDRVINSKGIIQLSPIS
ncbi:hypothetical protein ES703_18074 [subsurface metagenome]